MRRIVAAAGASAALVLYQFCHLLIVRRTALAVGVASDTNTHVDALASFSSVMVLPMLGVALLSVLFPRDRRFGIVFLSLAVAIILLWSYLADSDVCIHSRQSLDVLLGGRAFLAYCWAALVGLGAGCLMSGGAQGQVRAWLPVLVVAAALMGVWIVQGPLDNYVIQISSCYTH